MIFLLIKLPMTGFLGLYLRAMVVAPVIGWYIAKRIAEKSAQDMRTRWEGLLSGGGVIAKIPRSRPEEPPQRDRPRGPAPGPGEALRRTAVQLRLLRRPPKGILGMGTRWGSWQLAEDLVPQGPPARRSTSSAAGTSSASSTTS